MTKYDDASWHYGGDFPSDLPIEAGGTHIGMFVTWALLSGLAGDIHLVDFAADLAELRARQITPGAFFMKVCDGKFTNEDLNDEGNAFADNYFEREYVKDYAGAVPEELPSLYHFDDSWPSYDKLSPILDRRLAEWRSTRLSK